MIWEQINIENLIVGIKAESLNPRHLMQKWVKLCTEEVLIV